MNYMRPCKNIETGALYVSRFMRPCEQFEYNTNRDDRNTHYPLPKGYTPLLCTRVPPPARHSPTTGSTPFTLRVHKRRYPSPLTTTTSSSSSTPKLQQQPTSSVSPSLSHSLMVRCVYSFQITPVPGQPIKAPKYDTATIRATRLFSLPTQLFFNNDNIKGHWVFCSTAADNTSPPFSPPGRAQDGHIWVKLTSSRNAKQYPTYRQIEI